MRQGFAEFIVACVPTIPSFIADIATPTSATMREKNKTDDKQMDDADADEYIREKTLECDRKFFFINSFFFQFLLLFPHTEAQKNNF
jgi:hypothetical protein